MGETLTTVIVIGIATVLLFVFPMQAMSEKNDEVAQLSVQSLVTEYVNKVSKSGLMTLADYEKLESSLSATGNSYDIEIELRIADKNPGKKAENQKIGDTTYYSLYTNQIKELLNKEPYKIQLKQGDFIKVTVKNTNTTMSQMFKNLLYGLTGNESYVVFAQYSTSILATGNTSNNL